MDPDQRGDPGSILDQRADPPAGAIFVDSLDLSKANIRRPRVVRPPAGQPAPRAEQSNVPEYWLRPSRGLASTAGTHRFIWDLHEDRPALPVGGYPMWAVPHDTPAEPQGPWVVPGEYRVRLTVEGRSLEQPLTIRMDPRVTLDRAGLQALHDLSCRVLRVWRADSLAMASFRRWRASAASDSVRIRAIDAVLTGARGARGGTLQSVADRALRLYSSLEASDQAPTAVQREAAERLEADLAACERMLTGLQGSEPRKPR